MTCGYTPEYYESGKGGAEELNVSHLNGAENMKIASDKDLADFSEAMRDALEQCVERGMQFPLIVCSVCSNGSVLVMRTDGENPGETLAEHIEGGGFATPINCMVVDQTGGVAHVTITAEGATFH